MWNRLLAAMLTVGRKARLLSVGRRSLATSVPMGGEEGTGWGGGVGAGPLGPQGRQIQREKPAPFSRGSGGSWGSNAPEGGRDIVHMSS